MVLKRYSGQTTAPAWRGQPKVLYRPTCEAYAPSPSDTDPSCREVAELAMKLFDMSPLELLQVGSFQCKDDSPQALQLLAAMNSDMQRRQRSP